MDNEIYRSPFGLLDVTHIPAEYRPNNHAQLDHELEQVFAAGGNTTGATKLKLVPEVCESGHTGRTIFYLEIPFTGSILHEVVRK